jgi:hypothetical protein
MNELQKGELNRALLLFFGILSIDDSGAYTAPRPSNCRFFPGFLNSSERINGLNRNAVLHFNEFPIRWTQRTCQLSSVS